MQLTEHEQKLLLRALDKASASAEAEKAAEAFINLLRKRGINGYDFLKQFESQSYSRPQEQQRQYQPPPQPAPPHPQPWRPEPKRKFPWLYLTLCFVIWLISHNVIMALIVGTGIAWMIQKRIILHVIGAAFALGLLYVGLVMSPTNTLNNRYASEPVTGEFQPSMQDQIDRYKAYDEVKQAATGSYTAPAPAPTPEMTPLPAWLGSSDMSQAAIDGDKAYKDFISNPENRRQGEEMIRQAKEQVAKMTQQLNDQQFIPVTGGYEKQLSMTPEELSRLFPRAQQQQATQPFCVK